MQTHKPANSHQWQKASLSASILIRSFEWIIIENEFFFLCIVSTYMLVPFYPSLCSSCEMCSPLALYVFRIHIEMTFCTWREGQQKTFGPNTMKRTLQKLKLCWQTLQGKKKQRVIRWNAEEAKSCVRCARDENQNARQMEREGMMEKSRWRYTMRYDGLKMFAWANIINNFPKSFPLEFRCMFQRK